MRSSVLETELKPLALVSLFFYPSSYIVYASTLLFHKWAKKN